MQETIQKRGHRETERIEQIDTNSLSHKLWFERLIAKAQLPLQVGIPIISLAPAVLLWYLGIDIRIATDFTGVPLVSLPMLILNMIFLITSSVLISRQIEGLRNYAATLTPRLDSRVLNRLYSLTPIIIVWAILVAASGLIFDPLIFKLYYPIYQSLLRVVVTSYLRFAQATFLWVLGYSMYSIYKWGRLPVKLRSFAEDPTLGLKPFGTVSLYLVTLYVVGVLLTFPIGVYVGDAVRTSQSIFFLLGLVIFVGPLLGLRRTLLEEKQDKLSWIGSRHRRVLELVEMTGDAPLDLAVVNELVAIDSIRRDIQQISAWPFSSGIFARLVTVVMLPLILAMIATYLIHILQL